MPQQDLFNSSPAQPQDTSAQPGAIVVRETPCKSILNTGGISDYSLNCYTGCAHACVYCYARFMQRFHPHHEPWGSFVDVKTNAVEVLERRLRRAEPGHVFVSSACDGWQPLEEKWRLTRRCCELLLARGFRVHALTKSDLILRDLDLFARHGGCVGVTLTTLDEDLRRLWEPAASPVQARLQVLREARRLGIETTVMFGPLLPFLSDTQDAINALFREVAALEVSVIWVDALNARPRVWPSVAELLGKRFAPLRNRYQRILFDRAARESYVRQLRERVTLAAESTGTTRLLAGCP